MKELKIKTVCGFGIGSSLILKMTLDRVLDKLKIEASTEASDITSLYDDGLDFLLTSDNLYDEVLKKVQCKVVVIDNFISEEEIEEKVLEILKDLNK